VHRFISLASLLFFVFSLSLPVVTAQQVPNPPQPPQVQPVPQPGLGDEGENGIPPEMRKRMQKMANQQRQAELKRDTDKLLKLSTELKAYVDKTNENILSVDVIKKADEIEKLAHSVKEKMRGND
jgi:hypothetical protein